jgi:four helix bundle protein
VVGLIGSIFLNFKKCAMISYKKLDLWIYSMEMVKEIYELTKSYPKDELFGLISQTKRAAVSIPTNIAEGLGRKYKKDSIQFLHISRGSAYEVETLLSVAVMTNMINQEAYDHFNEMVERIIRLLNGFIHYLEQKPHIG